MGGEEIISEIVKRLDAKNKRCHDGAILAELRKMKESDFIKIKKEKAN